MICVVCRKPDRDLKRPLTKASPDLAENGFHEDCFEKLKKWIREADIVLGVDPKTGEQTKVIYGEALLELIAARLEDPGKFKVLRVPIDLSADDLELVTAVCV